MTLATNLRRLRMARGLSQRALAHPAYSDAYISTIESGRRQPSQSALEYFADKLGVSIEQLKTGVEPALPAQLELRLHEARVALSAGDVDEAMKSYDRIAREARRFQLDRLHASALWGLGMCAEHDGDAEEAISRYEQAEGVLEAGPPTESVEPLAAKARCLIMTGDLRYAIHLLEGRIDRLERANLRDPDALVRLYATLVSAYFEAGLFKRASEAADDALRFAPRARDRETLAAMKLNVARALIERGDIDEAKDSLRQAEELYRELDLVDQLGKAHFARGFVFSREGDLAAAEREFGIARDVLVKAKSRVDAARVATELASVKRQLGEVEHAITLVRDAIDALGDADPAELGQAHRELALCVMESEPENAEKHLRRSIELFERSQGFAELASSYRILGDLFTQQGNVDGGCESYRTGITVIEERL